MSMKMPVMISDTNNSMLSRRPGYRNKGVLGFCYKGYDDTEGIMEAVFAGSIK